MPPVRVDVIHPLPEGWGLCLSCEMLLARANLGKSPYERGQEQFPQEWLEDLDRLTALVLNLATSYGDTILIRLYDPRSFQGLIKSIRHGARRYPSFIINGKERITGWDIDPVEHSLLVAGAARRN